MSMKASLDEYYELWVKDLDQSLYLYKQEELQSLVEIGLAIYGRVRFLTLALFKEINDKYHDKDFKGEIPGLLIGQEKILRDWCKASCSLCSHVMGTTQFENYEYQSSLKEMFAAIGEAEVLAVYCLTDRMPPKHHTESDVT